MSEEHEHNADADAELYQEEYLFQQRSAQSRFPRGITPTNGWSGSGKIVVPQIPFGVGVYAPQGEIAIQTAFPVPGYHTVQFNVQQLSPPILDGSFLNPLVVRPQAEVIWSCKGVNLRRLINITDGSAISGTGESVTIRITDDSFPKDISDNTYEYLVSVAVAPGLRPIQGGVQPPVKYASLGFWGGAISSAVSDPFDPGGLFEIINPASHPSLNNKTNIVVPQNCGVNSFLLNVTVTDPALATPTGGEILVVQDAGAPGITQNVSAANYDGGCNRWVPLVPGARIIRIENNYEVSATSHLLGSIIFGVEG